MIDLKKLVGENVEIITNNNQCISGYVDTFCSAEDNDDFEPDEAEDGICIDVDGEGGPFILSSHIKSIKLLN